MDVEMRRSPQLQSVIETYSDFWEFYVREHSKPATRILHFVGISFGILLLIFFISTGRWSWIPVCFVTGYALAWAGHFLIEKNRPATFKYPLWSFISDYKMMWYMVTGRMDAEVKRAVRTRAYGRDTAASNSLHQ